jgi:exodeoxyribonuclease-5
VHPPRDDFVRLAVSPEEEPRRRPVEISVLRAFFEGREDDLAPLLRRESDEFTFGYTLTVHKAQGSQ